MPPTPETALPRNPYRNLVLLALATLSGHGDSPGLLEDAHRLVTGALPRGRRHPRPHEYARTRRRVLRRSLRPRSWHPRGQAGLRVSPVDGVGGEARSLEALDGLDAPARAAYTLMRLESLDTRAATGLLRSVGVRDPATAVERARRAPSAPPLPDPTVVRVSGRGSWLHRRGLVAGTGALVLVVAALGLTTADPGGGTSSATLTAAPPRLASATAPDTWRESFRLDLNAWHPRGAAVEDDALLRRALTAWSEQESHERGLPPGAPRVLFAGTVADREVVLLHDGPRVARYTRRDGAGTELVEVFAEPANGVANWPALRLADTGEGTHYLLPPWVTEAATAPLGNTDADWSDVRLQDGVTEALPTGGYCGVGPVLRLRAPEVAHGEPYSAIDLGGLDTAHLGYMPPDQAAGPARGAGRGARLRPVGRPGLCRWGSGGAGTHRDRVGVRGPGTARRRRGPLDLRALRRTRRRRAGPRRTGHADRRGHRSRGGRGTRGWLGLQQPQPPGGRGHVVAGRRQPVALPRRRLPRGRLPHGGGRRRGRGRGR